jgi:hypothetical protein
MTPIVVAIDVITAVKAKHVIVIKAINASKALLF